MPARVRSRYFGLRTLTDDAGRTHIERREPTQVPVRPDDLRATVREGESLHHLAHRLWGDAQLFWLLADANDILDPTLALAPGRELRAPRRPEAFLP